MTTYYRGMVAIPYRPDSSMYAAAIGKNLLAPQVTLEHTRIEQERARATKLTPDSRLLYN